MTRKLNTRTIGFKASQLEYADIMKEAALQEKTVSAYIRGLVFTAKEQREKIEALESELSKKPKQVVKTVKDDKQVKELQAQVKALESELSKKPKQVVKTVKDDKQVKALQAQVKALESELSKKPKQVVKTVKDDKQVKELQAQVKGFMATISKLRDSHNETVRRYEADIEELELSYDELKSQWNELVPKYNDVLERLKKANQYCRNNKVGIKVGLLADSGEIVQF